MTATDPARFDAATFLRDYWQKQPLLIRNPWREWTNPLEPDELAGLACDPEVESRLVTHSQGEWQLEHGPLSESRFGQLDATPWTLLVQAVDHHVPQVAALIEPFRFIPSWRIDDVMVSYAADGGGVGPHFDQYDVFLVQGLGRRRWRLGATCDHRAPLLPHPDLRLLAQFETVAEWVLEPGDILYVPPGVAHDGVAVGDDCMTYSVGFRAPSRADLIAGWSDSLLGGIEEDDRYTDPDLMPQDNPGEITAAALDRLQAMMLERMADRTGFARWFGQHSTAPRNPQIDWRPEAAIDHADLRQALADGTALVRNPASRFSFIRQDGDALQLFVDGRCIPCSGEAAALAARLCASEHVTLEPGIALPLPALELLAALIDEGAVALDVED